MALVALVVLAIAMGIGAYFLVMRLKSASGAAATTGGRGRGAGGVIPVKVAEARRGDMNLFVQGLGTVTPLNTVTVKSRVDGQIMKVAYTEGEFVKEGQLLVQIDPRPYQVQLEQAQGQLQRDQAQLENAKLDLNRYQSIPQSVTQQQIDQQKATVQQFVGTVLADQSAVDNAKLNLTYCQITAPITGRIGLRQVDVGNIVHATDNTGVAVITQLQPITVVFPVTETQISDVFRRPDHGQGVPVEAYSSDLSKDIASGKVLAIDNQIDPNTGTVKVEAEYDNANFGLFPGQFVNAKMLVDTLKNVVIVPSAAVQKGPQSQFVYVVKPDKTVQLQTVTPGPLEGSEQVIEQGVNPGQLVVTDGIDKLTQGTKVTISTGNGKGGAAGAATRPSSHGGAGGRSGGGGKHNGATTRPAGTAPTAVQPEAQAQ